MQTQKTRTYETSSTQTSLTTVTTLMVVTARFPMIKTLGAQTNRPLATLLSALEMTGQETWHRILKFNLNNVFRILRRNALATLLIDLWKMRSIRTSSSALTFHLQMCVTRYRRRRSPRFATLASAFNRLQANLVLKALCLLVNLKTVRLHKRRRWQCISKTSQKLVTCRLELHADTKEKKIKARVFLPLVWRHSNGLSQLSWSDHLITLKIWWIQNFIGQMRKLTAFSLNTA